jgi:type IV pilus assembly protein PilE
VTARRHRIGGFTLVELLACVAIATLLAGIGWPTYRDVVLRARRHDARVALLRIQAQQERLQLQSGRYVDDLSSAPALGGLGTGPRSEAGHYRLQVRLRDDARGYVATATPDERSPQREDRECAALWVDETGRRGATGTIADAAGLCWLR